MYNFQKEINDTLENESKLKKLVYKQGDIICGINNNSGHDKAYCILQNGKILEHIELERYDRIKGSNKNHLKLLIEKCKYLNTIKHVVSIYPFNLDESSNPEEVESYKKLCEINKNFKNVIYLNHHLTHVAHGYYSSNFDEALILSFDGSGERNYYENETFSLFYGKNNKLENLYKQEADLFKKKENASYNFVKTAKNDKLMKIRSLGRIYQRPTCALGFNYFQTGSLMGMAAYGKPKYVKELMKIEPLLTKNQKTPEEKYRLTNNNFYRKMLYYGHYKKKVLTKEYYEKDPFPFDIAASVQFIFEEQLIILLKYLLTLKNTTNICFSGGCSLNCLAMRRVRKEFPNIKFYIPPVPYDAGLCLGAAQYLYHDVFDNKKINWNGNFSPYMGGKYDINNIKSSLTNFPNLTHELVKDENVIDFIYDKKIVAVYGGRSECGRRALGNRSILADPRDINIKNILNEKVKHRPWFRPFAPSVLDEEVVNWFEKYGSSPYMCIVLKFKDGKGSLVEAVNHPDQTARLQTVTEKDNKWYYNFIKKWHKKSGVPIILNTSFNDNEPICETPMDALKCYSKTNIDYLYFFDYNILVSRKA